MLKPKYKNIKFWDPVIGSQEIKLINKALKMNWPNEGHFTSQFEKRIEKLLNVKHAICTTSGTISIFLALKAVGIKQNDEVGSVLENSVENIEFFLGSCCLNLSYFPQSCEITKYELTNLLKKTNIKAFFVSNTTNSKIISFLKQKKIKILNIDTVDIRKIENKIYSKKIRLQLN